MKKVSNNVILKVQDSVLSVIQTGPDYTFIESRPIISEDAYVCVDAIKFFAMYEDSSQLTFNEDYLDIKTGKSKAKLPYMKEYGIFNAEKEIEFPDNLQIEDTFEIDFSKIDLDLENAVEQYSYILFNRNFTCRYLYNTLSFYGKLEGDWYNVTPIQFKLLKSLGKVTLSISSGLLKAINCDNQVLILKLYQSVINLHTIERFFNEEPIVSFKLNDVNSRKMKTFMKDFDVFNFERFGNEVRISTNTFEDSYELLEVSSDETFDLNIFKKDLENLQGFVRIYSLAGMNYIISNPEENKTVLFLCER